MKKAFAILITVGAGYLASGQTKQPTCNCPKKGHNASGKADMVFDLGGGHKIAICGMIKKKDTTCSEYILFQCGSKEIIDEADYQTCKITQHNDTLIVAEFSGLPVGKNFEPVYRLFRGEKYFFQQSGLTHTVFYSEILPKYRAAQIKTVLSQYARLKLPMNNYDTLLLVADRLCWAYISGSSLAERRLGEMEKKFGPFDGAIKEEFDNIWGTYSLWKHDNHLP